MRCAPKYKYRCINHLKISWKACVQSEISRTSLFKIENTKTNWFYNNDTIIKIIEIVYACQFHEVFEFYLTHRMVEKSWAFFVQLFKLNVSWSSSTLSSAFDDTRIKLKDRLRKNDHFNKLKIAGQIFFQSVFFNVRFKINDSKSKSVNQEYFLL